MTYSLIIPHYNIPTLLIRCLNSIPVRSDLQIIVVDDNSTQENKEKLKEIEANFKHVEFIYSTPGRGGGAARNIGLKAAKGDYVFFADADDFFMPSLSQILDDVSKTDSDLIFFNAISVDTDFYTFTYRCWHLNRWIRMHKKKKAKAEFDLRYAFGEPWCKLIKRSVIKEHQIWFDETKIHNDTRFSYLSGFYAKTVSVDQRALYCVTERSGSVSKNLTPERLIKRAEVFAQANKFFKEHGIKRFDERAIRPLIKFLLMLDFTNFCKCKRVLQDTGMTSLKIYSKLLLYPIYAFRKFAISMSQYKMRLIG